MTENSADPGTSTFQFASQFCFPRLSGTKGNQEAQELIKKTLQNSGLSPIEEEFQASYLLINLFRFAMVPIGIFILLGYFSYLLLVFKFAVVFFVMALFLGIGFMLYCQTSPSFLGWRKNHWTKNILARIGPENPDQEIIFIAHYDTKSQSFPAWLRIAIYYCGSILPKSAIEFISDKKTS